MKKFFGSAVVAGVVGTALAAPANAASLFTEAQVAVDTDTFTMVAASLLGAVILFFTIRKALAMFGK